MSSTFSCMTGCLARWTILLALALAPFGVSGRLMAIDPWKELSDAAACHDPAGSQKILEALLLAEPTFYAGHYNLGTILMASDPSTAAAHLELATSGPSVDLAANAWHNLALLHYSEGRLEDAVGDAQHACTLRPHDDQEQRLFSELRRVLIVRADEARRTAEEEARKLHLATTALPDGHAQEAYDQRLSAAGGSGGYRFSLGAVPASAATVAPGSGASAIPPPPPALPAGLVLDSDGRIHVIPEKAGQYVIAVALRDSTGTTIASSVTLSVIPAPQITTSTLPEAVRGSPYTATLDSVGLDQPAWTIEGLPDGLHLDPSKGPSATISGAPHLAAIVQLLITAHDVQRHATRQLTLVISDLFAPEQPELPPATAWAAYHSVLSVRGPTQTYRWQAAAQGGILISADGIVSGAPEKAGALAIHTTVTAQDGRHRDVILTLPVNPPPIIDEAKPIELTQGQAVERPLVVAGGTPPYLWHLADGVLPKGLRLDADGAMRGAASEPGQVVVTAAVADHWLADTQQKITVIVKPSAKTSDQQQQNNPAQQDQEKNKNQGQQKEKENGKENGKDLANDKRSSGAGQQDQKSAQSGPKKQDGQPNQQGQQGQKPSNQSQEKNASPPDQQGQQGPTPGHQGSAKPDAQPDQPGQQPGQAAPGTPDTGGMDKHASPQGQASGAALTPAQDAARQAHLLNQAAADRWLDQLPKEDRGVLRYQLLEGGESQPTYKGKPW